jgi:hypothetical protein
MNVYVAYVQKGFEGYTRNVVITECDFDICSGFREGMSDFLIFITSNQCT